LPDLFDMFNIILRLNSEGGYLIRYWRNKAKLLYMRLKSGSLIIPFLLIVSSVVNGQVHFGATTAYNATFVLDEGLKADPRYNSTYTYQTSPIGFNLGVDFGRKFGLQLESILSNQGQIYNVINTAKEIAGTRKIDLQYIHLPLMMKFMSGGSGGVRGNFNFGPQLSILNKGIETLQTSKGDYEIPEGVDFETIKQDYPAAELNSDGTTYNLPNDVPTTALLQKELDDFKNTEFQIAAAFGLDFDLSRHLFLTTQIRANYSLTDMRNEDVINKLKSGDFSELFGGRANFLVGVQLGLHYYFGTLRSFK
jgi:Outer membrane protein beta-barrel domain